MISRSRKAFHDNSTLHFEALMKGSSIDPLFSFFSHVVVLGFSFSCSTISPTVALIALTPNTMGGKTWSRLEEEYFWDVIIPQSPKGVKPSERCKDWEQCARHMQDVMGTAARRKYTKLMLCK